MPNARSWRLGQGYLGNDTWTRASLCACKDIGHAVAIIHCDHEIHFRYGARGRNWNRDYWEYCGGCDHICYETRYGMDNGEPERIGEFRITNNHPDLMDGFVACLMEEELDAVPQLLYDSKMKRPAVKLWGNGDWYWVRNYGGTVKQFPTLEAAADEALANFFLYGGYRGEIFNKQLRRFIAKLTEVKPQILNGIGSERCVFLSGVPGQMEM
jgi:hypothetical protein